MDSLLLVFQIFLAGILIVLILFQARGTGFARSLGGASSFTRRGLERFVFKATFVFSGFFLAVSILSLIF